MIAEKLQQNYDHNLPHPLIPPLRSLWGAPEQLMLRLHTHIYMNTTYRLTILGRDGMYTYGDTAASPALAKMAPGQMQIKDGDRLGVHQAIWRESVNKGVPGRESMCIDRLMLVEAENFPGQWEIGVLNGAGYRPATQQ